MLEPIATLGTIRILDDSRESRVESPHGPPRARSPRAPCSARGAAAGARRRAASTSSQSPGGRRPGAHARPGPAAVPTHAAAASATRRARGARCRSRCAAPTGDGNAFSSGGKADQTKLVITVNKSQANHETKVGMGGSLVIKRSRER